MFLTLGRAPLISQTLDMTTSLNDNPDNLSGGRKSNKFRVFMQALPALQEAPDPGQGPAPVAQGVFLLQAQLGEGFTLIFQVKNRIITEAACALGFAADLSLNPSRSPIFPACGL